MRQLKFANVDNDQPTQTVLTLKIPFTHTTVTTQAEADAMIVEALTAYAKRLGLDIYLRDEKECATGVDEDLLLLSIEDHLRKQIVQAVTAQRLENDEVSTRAQVAQMLLGES